MQINGIILRMFGLSVSQTYGVHIVRQFVQRFSQGDHFGYLLRDPTIRNSHLCQIYSAIFDDRLINI